MDEVIAWLLAGDVAVEYQARRDLLDDHDLDLQRRIATEGYGARLLAARTPDGHWGDGFYQPKWTSSHYTLLELRRLELPRQNPSATNVVARILADHFGPDGGLNPTKTITVADACVNGMALDYCTWFHGPSDRLARIVDFLLGQRLLDGGFNCRANRSGARHSSLHTTTSVLEGINTYLAMGHSHRAEELEEARATAAEFLLRHRLFRSERTGGVIRGEFTRLHHPARWYYDILRGLDEAKDSGHAGRAAGR
jgi:hypothetical protein